MLKGTIANYQIFNRGRREEQFFTLFPNRKPVHKLLALVANLTHNAQSQKPNQEVADSRVLGNSTKCTTIPL